MQKTDFKIGEYAYVKALRASHKISGFGTSADGRWTVLLHRRTAFSQESMGIYSYAPEELEVRGGFR